uniref:lysozyme n=1 Tax=Oncorhynchus mykiss TaxID=8022 RepID=A0A8K9XIF1_ONCMY
MEGTRGWPSDQQHFLKMMHLPRITKRTQSPHRETVSPVLSYYSEPAYLQHRKDVTRDLAPLPGATRRGALDEEDQEETLSLRSMPSMRSTLSHASKVKRSRGFPKRHTIPELRLPPVTKIHPDPRASLELRGTGYLRCSRLSPIIKSTRTHEPLHQERPPGPAGYRKDKPDRDNMKMQMLVVLAVAALVPSLSEGRILSKCELKNLLEKEALKFNMTGGAGVKNLTNNDFVAKIVCHVEKASGFNTSFVTAWRDDDGPDVLPTRPAKPPKRGKRHAGNHFTSGEESSSEEETMGTLYGLFQLSDRVICSSGSTPSLNLCQMNCSALIDDNISDDFNCVKTIKQTMESGRGQQTKALKRMINLLFQKECVATVASSYFSKC